MFMKIMQYQYVWHKADSSVFNLEILILMKDTPSSDRPIIGKVDEIMEKVEQDYIGSYDIERTLITKQF